MPPKLDIKCICETQIGKKGPDGQKELGIMLPCNCIIGHICLTAIDRITGRCPHCNKRISAEHSEVLQAGDAVIDIVRMKKYFETEAAPRKQRFIESRNADALDGGRPLYDEVREPEDPLERYRTRNIRHLFPGLTLREAIDSLELIAFIAQDPSTGLVLPEYMADAIPIIHALYTRREAEAIADFAGSATMGTTSLTIGDLRLAQVETPTGRETLDSVFKIAERPCYRHFGLTSRAFSDDEVGGGSNWAPNAGLGRSKPIEPGLWAPLASDSSSEDAFEDAMSGPDSDRAAEEAEMLLVPGSPEVTQSRESEMVFAPGSPVVIDGNALYDSGSDGLNDDWVDLGDPDIIGHLPAFQEMLREGETSASPAAREVDNAGPRPGSWHGRRPSETRGYNSAGART